MKSRLKLAAAALVGLGALALSTLSASAAIVCNPADGVCWHVRHPYRYRAEWGLVVHPDNWRWGPGERWVIRDHPGRGYWRGGVWVSF